MHTLANSRNTGQDLREDERPTGTWEDGQRHQHGGHTHYQMCPRQASERSPWLQPSAAARWPRRFLKETHLPPLSLTLRKQNILYKKILHTPALRTTA